MRSTRSQSASNATGPGRRCSVTRSVRATTSISSCSARTGPTSRHGVNLDVLARRDPSLYGGLSLNELETKIYEWAHALDISARCRQSNNEGEYIEWIHDAYDTADGLIVNPGAWSHYSYAI